MTFRDLSGNIPARRVLDPEEVLKGRPKLPDPIVERRKARAEAVATPPPEWQAMRARLRQNRKEPDE